MVSYLGVVRTVMMADTAQFNRAVAGASAQFRMAAAKMRSDAQSLVGISGALNLAITIPAIMAARSITKLGITYESNMQKIKHVAGMTQKQLETLNKAQIQLSKDIRTRPSELSRVGYMAAQAQILTPRAIREVQKAVAMAQKVQPGDAPVETVAAGLITNLKAFKIPIQDSVQTMAEMIKTVDLGSLSWEQYSRRITQVAAVAANIGGKSSFKNMNIALALATQGGVQGGEAATALRNLYLRIYERSNKKDSVLNQAAVSANYKDAADMFENGAGGSLTKYMQMLSSGHGTARGATSAGFLRREITSALTLMNASFDEWQRYEKEYDSAFPDFKRRYEEFLKSPIGILQGVQAAFERVKLSAFTAIGPMIVKFLEGLEGALNRFANLPNIHKQFIALTIGLASLGTALASIWGVIQSITLSRRLNKILGKGAASGIGPLEAIDPSGDVARIAAAKVAKAEAAAAITQSKLRQTLRKEQEYAERAILKAKKAEAITAAKQAGDAARAAVVSQQLQAAILQAKASAAGFSMQGYRGPMGHPPGFVGNLFRSKNLLGAPPPPLFPFMPDRMAYTPMGTSWHGLTMPNYTGPSGRNATIDMVQLPDGSFGRRLQRPLLGEYGTASPRPTVNPMSSIPGASFYYAMNRPRSMPRMPSMGGVWGAIGGAMTRQRTMPSFGEGGQIAAISGLLLVLSQMALILEDTVIPALNGFGIPVSSLSELFSGLVTTVGVMLATLTGVIQALLQTFIALGSYIGITWYNIFKKLGRAFKAFSDWFGSTWIVGRYTKKELEERKVKREQEAAADKLVARDALKFTGKSALGIIGIGPESAVEDNITNYLERRRVKNDATNLGNWGANPAGSPMGGTGPTIDETLHDAQVQARESFQNLVEELSSMLSGGHSIGGAPGLFEAGTQEGYKALIQSNDSLLQVMTTLKEKTERFLSRIDDSGFNTADTLKEIHEFLKRQPGVTP
jgi:hypothetical protein